MRIDSPSNRNEAGVCRPSSIHRVATPPSAHLRDTLEADVVRRPDDVVSFVAGDALRRTPSRARSLLSVASVARASIDEEVCPLSLRTREELGDDAYLSNVDNGRLYSREYLSLWLRQKAQAQERAGQPVTYVSPITWRDMTEDARTLGILGNHETTGEPLMVRAALPQPVVRRERELHAQYIAPSHYHFSLAQLVSAFALLQTALFVPNNQSGVASRVIFGCAGGGAATICISGLVAHKIKNIAIAQENLPAQTRSTRVSYNVLPWALAICSALCVAAIGGVAAGLDHAPGRRERIIAGATGGAAAALLVVPLGYFSLLERQVRAAQARYRAQNFELGMLA